MKSEHRHELADNDLEVLIKRVRAKFAEAMELHGNKIMLWASLGMLLLAAVIFATRGNDSSNAQAWAELSKASAGDAGSEELIALADKHSGTPVGNWARLIYAERYAQNGVEGMFSDREVGKSDLETAKTAFNELLNAPNVSETIQVRAKFGLARVMEATSGADLKPAIEMYQGLLSDFPDSAYQTMVEAKIKDLEKKSAGEFYAWFADQNPKPEDRTLPTDLAPGSTPSGAEGEKPEGEKTEADSTKKEMSEQGSENAAKPGPALSVPSAPAFPPTGDKKEMSPEKKEAAPEKKTETPTPPKPEAPAEKKEAEKPKAPSAPEKTEATKE